jgi:hypothetical protein
MSSVLLFSVISPLENLAAATIILDILSQLLKQLNNLVVPMSLWESQEHLDIINRHNLVTLPNLWESRDHPDSTLVIPDPLGVIPPVGLWVSLVRLQLLVPDGLPLPVSTPTHRNSFLERNGIPLQLQQLNRIVLLPDLK